MSIEKLIYATASGNRIAFEKLYNQSKGYVFAIALAVLKNPSDAEDILHDTFLQVHRRAESFLGGSGKAWVGSIARNLALDRLRRRQREVAVDFTDADAPLVGTTSNEDLAEKIVLRAALALLDARERETVLLYQAGYKHREIAQLQGEKTGTVTWRYREALQKLRTYLQKGGDDRAK